MRFTNSDLTSEEIIEALMAAMGLPAYFPWRNFKNKNLFDGGVASTLDLGNFKISSFIF